MDYNNRDPFGGYNEPSRRDLLEIDSGGKTTAEHKKARQEEQQAKYDRLQNDPYTQTGHQSRKGLGGRFDRFNPRNRGRGSHSGDTGSWFSFLFGLALLGVLIYLVYASLNGGLTGVFRSFNSSPTENAAVFKNAFLDLEQKNHDFGKEIEDVYTKNRVYDAVMLETLPYPEYIVYVFTGNAELDEPFNNYIAYHEEKGTLPAPVYRIEQKLIENYKLRNVVKEEVPMFVIYTEDEAGVKTYDSVMTDPQYLTELEGYMKQLQTINDDNQRERMGVYGDSEGFKDLKKYFD